MVFPLATEPVFDTLPVFFNSSTWMQSGKVTQLLPGTAAKSKKRKLQQARIQGRMLCSYLYSLFTLLGKELLYV